MHQCKTCPENNPERFYGRARTRCKKCFIATAKAKYKALSPSAKAEYVAQQTAYQKGWITNNIFRFRWLSARTRAKRKNITFDITVEDLERIYKEQDGKCFYSDITMSIVPEDMDKKHYSMSVERIDSARGYTYDNVVLLCCVVNNMKNDLSLTDFRDVILRIADTIR
jgi:hypothetical protein